MGAAASDRVATTSEPVTPAAVGGTGALTGSLVAFGLASAAQGVPFVVVIATVGADASTGWVATVAAARVLPYLLCSPFAGALASRREIRSLWLWTGVTRSVLIAAAGCVTAIGASPGIGAAVVFATVAAGTPTYPTLMRLLHERVPRQLWGRACVTAAGVESAAFWAGPAIGGALLLVSPTVAIGVGLVLSVAAIASGRRTFLVRQPKHIRESATTARAEHASSSLRAAALLLMQTSARPAVVAALGANVLAGMVAALLVEVGRGVADQGAYEILSLSNGAGAVVAFVVARATIDRGHRPLSALAAAGGGVIALGCAGNIATAAIAMAALGASVLWAEVLGTVVVGDTTCSRSVATACGLLDSWIVTAMLLGTVAAPVLSGAVSTRAAVIAVGIVGVIAAAAAGRISATWDHG